MMHCKAENEFFSSNSQQESYIKEEIVIPDVTVKSDDDVLNIQNCTLRADQISFETLGKLTHKEQICNQNDTNCDEEIDVVNVDQTNEKLFIEAHKCKNTSGNIGSNATEVDNFDENTIGIDECKIKMEIDVTSDEDSLIVDVCGYTDEMNIPKDIREIINLLDKKSGEQTVMSRFLKKSSEPKKLSPITNSTLKAVIDKDTSKNTPKANEVIRNVITTKQQNCNEVECPTCGKKMSKNSIHHHKEGCGINVMYLRCKFCPYDTKYKQSMLKHIKKAHNNVKPHEYAGIIKKIAKEGEKIKANALKSTNGTEVNTLPKQTYYKDFMKQYCTKCDEISENISYKQRKCRKCGSATLLQCVKCGRRYMQIRTIYSHLQMRCATRNNLHCADCKYVTPSKRSLEIHISRKHLEVAPEDYERCSKCGSRYKYRFDRINHEKICHQEKLLLQCNLCPFKGKDKAYFNMHMQDHVLYPNVDDTADDARIKVGGPKPLSKKEELKVKKLVKAFCRKCNKANEYVKYSKRQCNKCKTKLTYPCGNCGKVYLQCHELRMHVIRNYVRQELKKRQQCSACNKWFALYEDLYVHQKHCMKQPSRQCEHCHFKTKYSHSLVRHIQRKHVKVDAVPKSPAVDVPKKFVCSQCKKEYSNVYSLAYHRKHFCGKQPSISCDHCSYKTYMKYSLIIHMKRKHNHLFTGQELRCMHCGKKNSNIYTHNTHVANCSFK